ncbi:MinD/ParA family ATP-binding protein [Rhizomonospora bruguierae]|uniref:MinD/ParA family ATP-binding protein n=1 Tax=Rhizomonospora bruguierae TaxID=1581705 RepID=UPI0020BFA1DE
MQPPTVPPVTAPPPPQQYQQPAPPPGYHPPAGPHPPSLAHGPQQYPTVPPAATDLDESFLQPHPGTPLPPPPQARPEAPGVYQMPPHQQVPPYQQVPPHQQVPQQQQMPHQPPPAYHQDAAWMPDPSVPTAEEFARRRAARPTEQSATQGVRAVIARSSMGLVKLGPGRREQEMRRDVETVRRNFGGLRQVTVINPKGGAGKTVAVLLLAMTFGQRRGGYVLAWDNNETQGTLGMRAQQDFHSRTVRDMLRDLGQFKGAHGRVGDLSQYVRSQGEGMFDVLASDESATAGEMLTAGAFGELREVVSRFYKLIFVDTGNNVRAQNWQAAIDATDQLVVTMSARNDSAETAARALDHLEQTGRQRLVRQAVSVVSMPPTRKDIDLPAIERHFAARTRAVLLAPYEKLIDSGEPLRYGHLSGATKDAWLKIAAAVAEGL